MTLTRQNWSQTHDALIATVADAAAQKEADSIERQTLLIELDSLRELRRHIRSTTGAQRGEYRSPLIAISVREYLNIPQQIIEDVGLLYDRYRRWKHDLEWID